MPLFGRLGRTLFACFGKGGTVDRQRNVTTEGPSDRPPEQESTDDHEETAILEAATAPEAEHNVATGEENVPHDVSRHPTAETLLSEDHSAPIENEAREFKSSEAAERSSQQDSECSSGRNRGEPEDVEPPVSEAALTPLKQSAAFGASQLQEPTDGHPASVQPLPDDPEAEHNVETREENVPHDVSSHPAAEELLSEDHSAPIENEARESGEAAERSLQQDSECSYGNRGEPEDVETPVPEVAVTALKQSAAFGAGQPQEEISKGPTDGHPASVQPLPDDPEAEHNVETREENVPHDVSSHPAAEELLSEDNSAPIENEARELGEAAERSSQQDSECSNGNHSEPEDVETPVSEAAVTALKQSAAFGAGQPQEEISKGPTDGHPASVQPLPDDPEAEHNVETREENVPHDVSSHPAAEELLSEDHSAPIENEARESGEAAERSLQQDSECSYGNRGEPEDVETPVPEVAVTALKQSAAFGAGQLQEEISEGPTNGHPASVQPLPHDLSVPGKDRQRTESESSASSKEVPLLSHHGSETSKSSLEETENLESAVPEAVVEPEQSTSKEQLEDEAITHGSLTYSTAAQQDLSAGMQGEQQTELEPSANAQPQEKSEHKETQVFSHTTPEAVPVVEQCAANEMHQLQEETVLHKNPDQPAVVQQSPEDFPKSSEDEQPSESTEEIQLLPQQDYQPNHHEAKFEVAAIPKTAAEHMQSGATATVQELSDEFYAHVQREGVAVQSVEPSDSTITGYVYVRNDAYEKLVTVRYTVDGWDSYEEIKAEWITSTDAQKSDKFRFVIPSLVPPYTVGFSIHYEVLDQHYWDDNHQKNYKVVHGYDISD